MKNRKAIALFAILAIFAAACGGGTTADEVVEEAPETTEAPATTAAPAKPSETFTQTKNAQQVPSPMGVMPSGNTDTDGRTFEDKIMDTMIGNFNSKNPWK